MTTVAGKKMIVAVSQAVNAAESQKQAKIEQQAHMVEKNRAHDLVGWLRQAEAKNGAAHPLMRSVRRAEEICGHPLCVCISKDLVLSSKGFRLTALHAPDEIGIFGIGTNVKRVTKQRIDRRLAANFHHEEIKNSVRTVLAAEDLRTRILYLGVDEWPRLGRVVFAVMSAATLTASSALFAFPFYFTHRADYAIALKPALG